MLTIVHAEDSASVTQTYARTCWLENPAIAAAYWHEVLGHTVGKIALDATASFIQPNLLTQGVNLILTSPATHPQAQQAIAATPLPPETFLTAHLTTTPEHIPQNTTFLIWQTPSHITGALALPTLIALEQAVRQGRIQAYGIHDSTLTIPQTPRPLHHWLEWAATAAQTVHQRRKRPALQVLALEIDLLNLAAFTTTNTLHKEETVSPLELAHRVGLATLGLCTTYPVSSGPNPAALQALTQVAEAEHALNTALGGWPTMGAQPLFSVLQALGAGAQPWPTPHHWQHWYHHLWPLMEIFLQTQSLPQAEALSKTVTRLLPFGAHLALHAAQPHLTAALSRLAATLPPSWAAKPAASLNAALLSSLPGLAALALTYVEDLQVIQNMGDYPDLAILFTSPPPSA